MAIGSETAGVDVETEDGTLELDLTKDKNLQKKAEELNGKVVRVEGRLKIRKGVEVPLRLIVTVKALNAAETPKR